MRGVFALVMNGGQAGFAADRRADHGFCEKRHVVSFKRFVCVDPHDLVDLVVIGHGFAGDRLSAKDDVPVFRVAADAENVERADVKADFFLELPDDGHFWRFALLQIAAGDDQFALAAAVGMARQKHLAVFHADRRGAVVPVCVCFHDDSSRINIFVIPSPLE